MAKSKTKKLEISRPKDGTACAKVWAIADKYKGDRAKTLKEAAQRKINPATASTQYGRWRVFNGIVGRKPAAAKAKKGPPPIKKKTKPKPAPAPASAAESPVAS